MPRTMIISRDAALKARALQEAPSTLWVDTCAGLEAALKVPPRQVLVDLNVEWEQDITECIAHCRKSGAASVIAFLHVVSGELAIRAHIAGADRVIPQNQLEDELVDLLRED